MSAQPHKKAEPARKQVSLTQSRSLPPERRHIRPAQAYRKLGYPQIRPSSSLLPPGPGHPKWTSPPKLDRRQLPAAPHSKQSPPVQEARSLKAPSGGDSTQKNPAAADGTRPGGPMYSPLASNSAALTDPTPIATTLPPPAAAVSAKTAGSKPMTTPIVQTPASRKTPAVLGRISTPNYPSIRPCAELDLSLLPG